ncbi:MAG: serine/threonine-protein kinase [Polyangiaceae bacterium]
MEIPGGQPLAGKYRIERVLGQGGMGVVVAAHHVHLDEVVAIKFLLPEALGNADAVARFEREARAAVRIKSEHVARVTDVGRLDNGAPYMVMELLQGRDLDVLLREQGPLSLAEVTDYLLQAGEAIAEAHGLGIVHRDLKPANLFLTKRADGSPCIKVLDFGISKLTNSRSTSDQGMTKTTAVMGSPFYMSPEHLLSSRDVDMRTDIWALGVICFELLTGQLPFQAETLPQLCMAISLSPPSRLRSYRPDLPAEFEAIVLRCLDKDPGQRYATVAELAAELVLFAPPNARLSAERIARLALAAGFSTGAVLLPPSGTAAARTAAEVRIETIAEFGRTKSTAPATKRRLGVAIAAALAVGAGGTFGALRWQANAVSAEAASSATASASAVSPTSAQLAPPMTPTAPDSAASPRALSSAVPASEALAGGTPTGSAILGSRSRTGTGKVSRGSSAAPATPAQRIMRVDRSKPAESSKPAEPMNVVQAAAPPAASPSVPAQSPVPVPRSRL